MLWYLSLMSYTCIYNITSNKLQHLFLSIILTVSNWFFLIDVYIGTDWISITVCINSNCMIYAYNLLNRNATIICFYMLTVLLSRVITLGKDTLIRKSLDLVDYFGYFFAHKKAMIRQFFLKKKFKNKRLWRSKLKHFYSIKKL